MARRGIRVMLWAMIVSAAAIAAYFFWIDELAIRRDAAAARTFDAAADTASRAVMDVRAAQQAYVATGQGDEFWGGKLAASLAAASQALGAMRSAISSDAQSAIESASARLQDFAQMDRRAREYVRSGQQLLASDIIFSDGYEMTAASLADIDRARTAERQAVDTVLHEMRQRQWITLAAGALTMCLLTLLLVPVARGRSEAVATQIEAPVETRAAREELDLRARVDPDQPRRDAAVTPVPAVESTAPAQPPVDLAGVAALCTELARVTDTRPLPSVLARASELLDAAGIVLWIADPDGRELAPILAHGYPPQLVTRLGTISRDAENVTGAAFRTGLVQTVKGDASSNGAIAAPLMTATGCVGVMAAEVRHGGEQQDARLAAASIIAAQLATLVGPPVARGSKTEVAG